MTKITATLRAMNIEDKYAERDCSDNFVNDIHVCTENQGNLSDIIVNIGGETVWYCQEEFQRELLYRFLMS